MIRRIGVLGGPGIGKSTSASMIYSSLSTQRVKVELVREYAKPWAYEGRKLTKFDQVCILGQQMRNEEILLRNGVDIVVTDGPIPLTTVYARLSGIKSADSFRNLIKEFEAEYPSIYVFLNRNDSIFKEEGRFQNLEQSKEIDSMIVEEMEMLGLEYSKFEFNDWNGIVKFLCEKLNAGVA